MVDGGGEQTKGRRKENGRGLGETIAGGRSKSEGCQCVRPTNLVYTVAPRRTTAQQLCVCVSERLALEHKWAKVIFTLVYLRIQIISLIFFADKLYP